MGVLAFPGLILSGVLGFTFRNGGIPLEWVGGSNLDLWGLLVRDSPQSATTLLKENLMVWVPLYTLAHFVLYLEPQRSLFRPFKLNPRYPSNSLIGREVFRSLRGVAICTLYEVLVNRFHQAGSLPSDITPDFFKLGPDGSASLLAHLVIFPLLYLWADAHFYWTHRLLHTSWLYKRVHKEHHESFNPDPFSGLSMHWVESSIYFSSALLVAPVVPLWQFRLLSIGLLIFPLEGHWGYGDWGNEQSVNHYLHHAKFNWNYGSSPMWDHLMGTNYPAEEQAGKGGQRETEAREQAALVGCLLTEGTLAPHTKGQ